MSTPTLYQAYYSPWSERARWALDHHGIAYKRVDHVILLGEPLLRWRLRKLRGPVSIPAFVDGDLRIGDSIEIARHAEKIGQGAPLFPAGAAGAEVEQWIARANELMEYGRVRLLPRMLESRAARAESVPPALRGLAGVLDPVTIAATRFVQKKWARLGRDAGASEAAMRKILDAARARVGRGGAGASTLVGSGFSFADVALAVALQGIKPVEHPAMKIGPAAREVWTEPGLADEYADLLAWRDRVYAERRPKRASSGAQA